MSEAIENGTTGKTARDPVEHPPTPGTLGLLALQHALIAYSASITTPLVVGLAVGLSEVELAMLISANLVVLGLATVIQSLGKWNIGVGYPMVMGSTFTAIGPAIAIGAEYGLTVLFLATIISGIMTMLMAPWWGKLLKYFPPVVTGSIITIIGVSLLPASGHLILGQEGTPGYASASGFVLALVTIATVLAFDRFTRGIFKQLAVLTALVVGSLVALLAGAMDLSGVMAGEVFYLPRPFHLGTPSVVIAAILPMLIVQLVNMVESTGDTLAIGEIIGRKPGGKEVTRALMGDGVATALGGFFTPFPLVSFAQNVGLVQITGVFSKHVVAAAGLILALLGIVAPFGNIAAAIPQAVIGGITVVMFGSIAAVGIKILGKADLGNSTNTFVIAVAFGFAMIPVGVPDFWSSFPQILQPILSSSIASGGIMAFVLNLLLNEWQPAKAIVRGEDTVRSE